jgi:acetyl-CoA synthetase
VGEGNKELTREAEGLLCLRGSWPGMFRTLHGDHARYEATYFAPVPVRALSIALAGACWRVFP